MNEKPVAFLVAALVVAPLCATCIVGPVVIGSMVAGLWGWFLGNGFVVALAIVIVVAAVVYAVKRHHGRRDNIRINESMTNE